MSGIGVGTGSAVGTAVGAGVDVGMGVGTGVGTGFAVGAAVGAGVGLAIPNKIRTEAPDEEMLRVVIDTPETGSKSVWPTERGASAKLRVAGVASMRRVWVGVVYPAVSLTVTPLTTGSVVRNVSKAVPDACRNSMVR